MTALVLIVATQSVLLLLLFGATVELHRQVLQLRHHAGMVDNARPVEFDAGVLATTLPVPAAHRVDDDSRLVLLILSDGCTTCFDIAQHLATTKPDRVLALIEGHTLEDALLFLHRFGLDLGDDIAYDEAGQTAKRLGIIVTPAAVKFEGRTPIAATTVPSARQLDRLAEWAREPTVQLSHLDGAM